MGNDKKEYIVSVPSVKGVRRWVLATKKAVDTIEDWMEENNQTTPGIITSKGRLHPPFDGRLRTEFPEEFSYL